ncbi:hypothetical protein [Streptosporangium saharense]|uniref:hypothetical protein n=1 Tax=Streptosporangium saharense TaxID=1706840 RepID=UPI00343638D9
MRTLSSLAALATAALVVLPGTAHADSANLNATVEPGAEVFLSSQLTPTAAYRGNVLVRLKGNSQPTEVKVNDCHGRSLGKVAIPAGDHAAYVAAAESQVPECVRLKIKNVGDAPVTVTGASYF